MICNCVSHQYNLEKDRIAVRECDGVRIVGEKLNGRFFIRNGLNIFFDVECNDETPAEILLDRYLSNIKSQKGEQL